MMNGIRALDFTTGIAGGYCTKILADAGADVVKVEPPGGDPLRSEWSGGLFEYLHQSKRVHEGEPPALERVDVAVTNDPEQARLWHAAHPSLVVVSISPFGASGPWVGRPATELTLQAACGSIGTRGFPDEPPLPAGGRIGEWITGTYAALGTVAAVGHRGGRAGSWVDVAMLDCMAVTLVTFPSVSASFRGWPEMQGTGRTVEIPSVEPTSDGYAVFTTNSFQQYQDFLVMIGRADWLEDRGMARAPERFARRAEFLAAVHEWSRARTSVEALEEASAFRIPAGPVLNGSTVADFEQFVARGVYHRSPSGRFRQPRPPYRFDPPASGSGPGVDEPRLGRPLEGVRVLDCTAWWAGPAATQALASLGADVVKVEAVKKPDLMRLTSSRPASEDGWWEWGAMFHGANASKRGITLDLTTPLGKTMFERLAAEADLLVENYTPRVMEQFGLGWDHLHALNPRLVMVRMPAFGLDGPWRDRTGFAQTMECISGMAWATGRPDGPPVLPRGVCDPLAAMHAAIAAILALRARSADGQGRLAEVTMIEAALNITAEQIIAFDIAGTVIGRDSVSNELPRGVYRAAGEDKWIALEVVTDEQRLALQELIGGPLTDDQLLGTWISRLDPETATDKLLASGIAAAVVVAGRDIAHNPQLRHRGLFEMEDHPVTGRHELPGLPFRMTGVDVWMTRPSPTLGQHNVEVLSEIATAEEIEELRAAKIIGERLEP